jgi:hypothetical protein
VLKRHLNHFIFERIFIMQDNTLFADAISNIYVTGPLVRLELSQVELSTGKEISQTNLKVTGYVVLPIDAFANAVGMQQGLIEKLVKDGVLKKREAVKPTKQ